MGDDGASPQALPEIDRRIEGRMARRPIDIR